MPDPIVDVEGIAHGGHCIAHLDGQVVFVRHTLPGERVRIRVTERTKRFLRADAIEIITPALGRVTPPCRYAGECGGCDFQHVSPATQRQLLGDVIREQLRHLANFEWNGEVEVVHPDDLGWRTRMTYAVGPNGRLGLRRHRTHDVIAIDECVIASDRLPAVLDETWKADSVEAVGSSEGDQLVVVEGNRGKLPKLPGVGVVTADGERIRGKASVTERVGEHTFRVSGSGFWQVHPEAATTLVDAVMAGLAVRPGDRVADLYAGVGLFTAFLAEAVGEFGAVFSVESDPGGSRDARRNLHAYSQVRLVGETVEAALDGGVL
ncbi:MAG: TRAM domain-containing protein, partial [Aeromicrobium sp.]